jgi:hypothetical protein
MDQSFLTLAATKCCRAFTRVELLALLTALAFLAALVLPALANTRPRSARVICANNLRQIGAAMHTWGNDHGDAPLFYVYPTNGGTRLHALDPNVWLHFSWISNELISPRILLCPSDSGSPAIDFSTRPEGGYLHPNFLNRATSYLLSNQGGLRFDPDQYLSGDRNVGEATVAGSSIFGTSLRNGSQSPLRWLSGLHHPEGNLLRNDGRVEYFTQEQLQARQSPVLAFLFEFIVPR